MVCFWHSVSLAIDILSSRWPASRSSRFRSLGVSTENTVVSASLKAMRFVEAGFTLGAVADAVDGSKSVVI